MDQTPPLVLHVIHHLVIGGMENGVVNLINGLSPHDFRHAIVCIEDFSDFRKRLKPKDVPVVALKRSLVGVWRVRREIYRICREMQPAIVHTRNISGLDALLPARLAGTARTVHGEHGWDVDDLHGKKLRPTLLRRLHRPLVDHYVAVSKDIARYLVDRVGVAPRRLTQIYNGVDLQRFRPRHDRNPELFPARLRSDRMFVVGTVGRLQPIKDQETLLRSFARMVNSEPDLRTSARLVVVGDGPLFGNLQNLAESLGIAEITWLTGARPDVEDQLRLFDVFVLTSLNEGISNTILEAMASGLPIIATNVGGNVELVGGDQTGILVPPGDIKSLTGALMRYAHAPQQLDALGRQARILAERDFGLDTMISEYRGLYRRVLRISERSANRAPSSKRLAS